jgi:hypothetical protein
VTIDDLLQVYPVLSHPIPDRDSIDSQHFCRQRLISSAFPQCIDENGYPSLLIASMAVRSRFSLTNLQGLWLYY